MSLLIEKQKELESELSATLNGFCESPPFGAKPVINPLSKSFQLIRVQNQLIQKHDREIAALKAALHGMGAKV